MREDLKNRVGTRNGNLTILSEDPVRDKYKAIVWNCVCVCGNHVKVTTSNLKRTPSCGCTKGRGVRDLSNLVFGRLHVVSRNPTHGNSRGGKWNCVCSCGTARTAYGSDLSRRECGTSSCGCAFIKTDFEVGQVIGRFTLVSVATPRGKSRSWTCKCDCGNVVEVKATNIEKFGDRGCGCRKNRRPPTTDKSPIDSAIQELVRRYKSNARKRGLEWGLTDERAASLLFGNCAYTGDAPANIFNGNRGQVLYNGIDRLDNTKGYVESNVVSCSRRANMAKNDMPLQQFMLLCEKVVKHSKGTNVEAGTSAGMLF